MDTRKFKTALRRAEKAENELTMQCQEMSKLLQPFFNEEISVFFQPSDGFVVLHGDNYLNTPIEKVLSEIQKDDKFFK